ncbi:hypothetical protein ACRAWF_14045 [Streptomyces sp. L7]
MGHVRSNDEGWRVMGGGVRRGGGREHRAAAVHPLPGRPYDPSARPYGASGSSSPCCVRPRPWPGSLAFAVGAPGSYGYDNGDRGVNGATAAADAVGLDSGRDVPEFPPEGRQLLLRPHLDAVSDVYVSVTAVPPAGTTVAATDGIKVSLQNAAGTGCTHQSATFRGQQEPAPGGRLGRAGDEQGAVQGGGQYYVLVERVDASGSSSDTWGLELTVVSEPPLAQAGTSDAPQVWDSASPVPVTGRPGAVRAARGSPGRSP